MSYAHRSLTPSHILTLGILHSQLTPQRVHTSDPSTSFLQALPHQIHSHPQADTPILTHMFTHTPVPTPGGDTLSRYTHSPCPLLSHTPRTPLPGGRHLKGPGQLRHQAGSRRVGQVFPAAWAWPRLGDTALARGVGLGSSCVGRARMLTPGLVCLGLAPAYQRTALAWRGTPASQSWSAGEARGGARWAGPGQACLSNFKS